MRAFIVLLIVFVTSAAHASGGLSCEGQGKGVSFAFNGGVTRGMGGALFSFEGSAAVSAPAVAKDLRRVTFGRDEVAQYAFDRKRLALVLYRERTGSAPHGYVELSVDTRPTDDEGTYSGRYRLTVYDVGGTSGTGKSFNSEGKVSCFVE